MEYHLPNNFYCMQKVIPSPSSWAVVHDIFNTISPIEVESNSLPPLAQVFTAFELCKEEELKCVIVGQDPYHTPRKAHGLAFSVLEGTAPSLVNIRKEIAKDVYGMNDYSIVPDNLSYLAAQGVLLLNTALTTSPGIAGAHIDKWTPFTTSIMKYLGQKTNTVFMLWGAHAQRFFPYIHKDNLILTAAHPSPFSATKGFFGCKHFSEANEYLRTHQKDEIVW